MMRTIAVAAILLALQPAIASAQAASGVWQQKCSRCHGMIDRFTATALQIDRSTPVLRRNGQPLAMFLTNHGSLSTEEIEAMRGSFVELLSAKKQ